MTGIEHFHQLRLPPRLLCLQRNPELQGVGTLGVKIHCAVHGSQK